MKVIILLLILLSIPLNGMATIVFHDSVCVKGKEVLLRAETKKGIFRERGVLLEFFANGRSIGSSLSGGDAIAYKSFIPKKEGIYRIKIRSQREKVEGLLLCLKRMQPVIIIDIETLRESPFSDISKKDSIRVIRRLYKRFPIIYLQTLFISTGFPKNLFLDKRIDKARAWLAEKGYPEGPIFESIEDLFLQLKERGIPVRVVISTEDVGASALEHGAKVLIFGELEGAKEVDTWKDVEKELNLLP